MPGAPLIKINCGSLDCSSGTKISVSSLVTVLLSRTSCNGSQLKEKSWSDNHSNMFAIYITLTKGQRPSFKQFIKPSFGQQFKGFVTGAQVANRFISDHVI